MYVDKVSSPCYLRNKMKTDRGLLHIILVVFLLLGFSSGRARGATSDQTSAENPGRIASIIVNYTKTEWWVLRWSSNVLVCRVFTDHEGLPNTNEILTACGQSTLTEWNATPTCPELNADMTAGPQCSGLYLFKVNSSLADKTITVTLPSASVELNLGDCDPSPENLCPELPTLMFTGEEPLPNEHITAIHVLMDGKPTDCLGSTCSMPLASTLLGGSRLEFWADSSYGDSTSHFTAQVQAIDSGVTTGPGQGGWYVEVLSTQWRGKPVSTCAQTWQSFPPIGDPPLWLSTPDQKDLMASEEPYQFLAGRLISQGVVNAKDCPTGGVLPNGYADACGLEKARSEVDKWQNQFDERIIEVAKKTSVPAQLMKNLFAQESQFWPGVFNSNHLGLGHITDNGAEAVLLWDPSFYKQFCPLVLDKSVCDEGYVHLETDQQSILRGALALQAKTDCNGCTAGIDLSNANFSIDLFAQTLQANCEQVAQEVFNATQKTAGKVMGYEDLWKLTVANYHAGPGCISFALYSAWTNGGTMDWKNISTYLTQPCQGAIYYVEQIAK
jgi:hypothetical protein